MAWVKAEGYDSQSQLQFPLHCEYLRRALRVGEHVECKNKKGGVAGFHKS